jgi:hypothetical protein
METTNFWRACLVAQASACVTRERLARPFRLCRRGRG